MVRSVVEQLHRHWLAHRRPADAHDHDVLGAVGVRLHFGQRDARGQRWIASRGADRADRPRRSPPPGDTRSSADTPRQAQLHDARSRRPRLGSAALVAASRPGRHARPATLLPRPSTAADIARPPCRSPTMVRRWPRRAPHFVTPTAINTSRKRGQQAGLDERRSAWLPNTSQPSITTIPPVHHRPGSVVGTGEPSAAAPPPDSHCTSRRTRSGSAAEITLPQCGSSAYAASPDGTRSMTYRCTWSG